MVKKSNPIGVLDVEINVVETSDYFIKKVSDQRGIPINIVREMLRYNIISAVGSSKCRLWVPVMAVSDWMSTSPSSESRFSHELPR